MTPRQKQVIQLVVEKGLSPEEAALEVGVAPKTVYAHKRTAIKALRNWLRGEGSD